MRRGPGHIAAPVTRLRLPPSAALTATWRPDLLGGITVLTAPAQLAQTDTWGPALYRSTRAAEQPSPLTAVPYYIWANRGPNPMQVWLQE